MIALWIVVGLVAGVGIGFGARATASPSSAGKARAMALAGGSLDVTHSLDEIVEALRTAAQRVIPRIDGVTVFDQLGQRGERVELRVADPRRITLGAIDCGRTQSLDLPFCIALALVPLYGPLRLTYDGETYDVDGSLDRHQLIRELSRRQTAKLEAFLAARAARSSRPPESP